MRGTVWGAAGHRGRIRYGMGVAAENLTFVFFLFSESVLAEADIKVHCELFGCPF